MTKRSHKERFYPTLEQAGLLAQPFGCVRFVWNSTLVHRTRGVSRAERNRPHTIAEKRLVALKAEYAWLKGVSSVILQQALLDQKSAFDNFFNSRLRARYPRFKAWDRRQSIWLTKAAFRYWDGKITIAETKALLPIRWSRMLPGALNTVTISRDRASAACANARLSLCRLSLRP